MVSPGCYKFAEYLCEILDCEFSPYNDPVSTKTGILFGVFALSASDFFTPLRDCDTKIGIWVGTDVLQLQKMVKKIPEAPRWINQFLDLKLAGSENLKEELEEMGLEIDGVLETPPRYIFECKPLPADGFKIGLYAPPNRAEFYYTELMLEVAKEFPDIQFRLYGHLREFNEDDILANRITNNVWDLGYINMDENIDSFSAIIRVCKHDAISNSLIEYMQAGRYAITNQSVPHTINVEPTKESVVKALKEVRKNTKPDVEASKYWRSRVNHEVWREQLEGFIAGVHVKS